VKLIDKTRRTYIIYSILIFVISSTLIYFTLNRIFRSQQDEKLLWDKELIAAKIKYDYPLPIFEVDDFPAKTKLKDTLYFKDTIIYQVINGVEKHEAYRQLTSVETLHNRTYRIITRSSNVRNQDFILIITISVGVVVLLLIVTIFFINTNLMGSVWLPFYENLDILKKFSVEENKPIHLQESNIDEFQELNESLTKLTDKINSDFNNLKEFTENASHEMQTPLAIMQTKSEILLQSENLNKEQVQHIKSIYQSVQRLSKLNKTLLLLSKIENNQFPETEQINVKEAVDRHLEIYEDFIENKSLQVFNETSEEVTLEANPLLFDMVVSNLISNAIKHNVEGGSISIVANNLSLSVTNSGHPSKLSSSSLFERFKKDSSASNSFGLGLAIVKKVCDNYKWKIMHSYLEQQHTISIYF
jgi:signal transduction histidine kinase